MDAKKQQTGKMDAGTGKEGIEGMLTKVRMQEEFFKIMEDKKSKGRRKQLC